MEKIQNVAPKSYFFIEIVQNLIDFFNKYIKLSIVFHLDRNSFIAVPEIKLKLFFPPKNIIAMF